MIGLVAAACLLAAEPSSTAELDAPNPTPQAPPADDPIRVVMYRGPGVSTVGFEPAQAALQAAPGVEVRVVSARTMRAPQTLQQADVVVFMGGSGGRQGRALETEGRRRVRDFVAAGGGYIGVCAGAYLAMQGSAAFHKLQLVAARNLSRHAYRRGIAAAEVEAVGRPDRVALHFANGPIFEAVEVEGLDPFVPLARFETDLALPRHGTLPGQMRGTPAIVASAFGQGRVVLFSPNPALGQGEVAHPELLVAAVEWVGTGGAVPPDTDWNDVFEPVRHPEPEPASPPP